MIEAERDIAAERRALTFLLLTVFINIAGFGIVIPLLPFYAETFGIEAWQVTILFSFYSIGQLFGEMLWGRLSDRIGRRPVLIGTMLLAGLSYVGLAFARDYAMVALLRLVGGFFAGNIATVQAYVVDISSPKDRVGRLGLIGAAFGGGFILGPSIGGLLADPAAGVIGFRPPMLAAGGLGLLAGLGILLFVRESRMHVGTAPVAGHFEMLRDAWANPVVRRVMLTSFISVGSLSAMESVFALWTHARFQWGPHEVGILFALVGGCSVLVQGVLAGRIGRRFGEARMLAIGLSMTAFSLFVQTFVPEGWMVILLTLFSVFGWSMANPAIAGLISRATSPEHQGAMLGLNGSTNALARISGPIASGFLFSGVGVNAPYRLSALGMLIAVWLALGAGKEIRRLKHLA